MSLHITTIQASLIWEDKEANKKMLEEKISSVSGYTEVVVLPEMFTTGFSMKPEVFAEKMDGESVDWMRRIAKHKRVILTGSLMIEEEGNYYNRLIWMLPDGSLGHYDKRHRFAYAGEDEHFSSGHRRLIASVKGWRINLLICYDLRFPVWSRQSSPPFPSVEQMEKGLQNSPEYDVLIYVANWPERRSLAWKTLLVARAIENQCYVVGVNRTGNDGNQIYYSGDSMVIDPLGEIIYAAKDQEEIHTSVLEKTTLEQVRKNYLSCGMLIIS